MEMIKVAKKMGNSSAVLLPKKYQGRRISVTIIEEKPNLMKVMEILEENKIDMPGVESIILTGSYALNETDEMSDIDILIITDNKIGNIKSDNYEIVLYPRQNLLNKKNAKNNLMIKSMIKYGRPLLNRTSCKELSKVGITNTEKQILIKENKSKIKEIYEYIEILPTLSKKEYLVMQNTIVYSTVLRIRMMLTLMDEYSKKKLISLVGDNIFEVYRKNKAHRKVVEIIPKTKIKNLINILKKYNEEI